jgi:hypothetical protein
VQIQPVCAHSLQVTAHKFASCDETTVRKAVSDYIRISTAIADFKRNRTMLRRWREVDAEPRLRSVMDSMAHR